VVAVSTVAQTSGEQAHLGNDMRTVRNIVLTTDDTSHRRVLLLKHP
jgi:hypothetical protein